MKAVDFFCGAGGLSRGLLDAGIDVRLGVDVDHRCAETYEANLPPAKFFCSDVKNVSRSDIVDRIGKYSSNDLLFAACAPCQAFSPQRRSKTRRADATILVSFACIIESFEPRFVLIENVPGITKVNGFSAYRRFVRRLRTNGYQIAEQVLDAKYFGVPQTRRRFVLVAARGVTPKLPESDKSKNGELATVRDAIAHYPPISAGAVHPRVPNHQSASLSPLNLERILNTPPNGGDRRDWPSKLTLECHKRSGVGHTDVYGRMYWDAPAPTLTGRCVSLSNGRYGHPEQNRAISLREAASLQTFRDDFVFYGTFQHMAQQIGNAVPVNLAQRLGNELLNL